MTAETTEIALTLHEIHILTHSLGLKPRKRVPKHPGRNYFQAGPSGKDRDTCESLVAKGLMKFGRTMGLDYFWVNDHGVAHMRSLLG